MSPELQARRPLIALRLGEEFAFGVQPTTLESFRFRDVIFRDLGSIRRNAGISLQQELDAASQDLASGALAEKHPLARILASQRDIAAAPTKEAKARLMATRAKIVFSIGYPELAERAYQEAFLLDECLPARIGRAAVLPHLIYPARKGTRRTALWDEAMELVQEALDMEPQDPLALSLQASLLQDRNYL